MAKITARKSKHGTRWQAVVRRVGYPTAARTFDTRAGARDWAAEMEAAIKARRYHSPVLAEIALAEALDRYNREITSTKAVSTQPRERGCARTLIRCIGAETTLAAITPSVVARFRDGRLRQVSAYSVRLELALLSHLFVKARREWEIPVDNPVTAIDRPAPPQGRTRFLNEAEIARLLEECRASRNRLLHPFVLVLLHSAMRPGEVAGLRAGQIDLDGRAINLERTKNQDRRRVPLTAAAVEALRPLLAGATDGDPIMMPPAAAQGYAAISPANVFRVAFDRARKRAGLPWLHMHDLRHTAASWMIMRGVDIRTLAAILGHRTLQMVLRYTHLLDEHQRAAVDRIGDLGVPG